MDQVVFGKSEGWSGESVWEFGLAVPVLKVYWLVGGWWYGGRLSVAEG